MEDRVVLEAVGARLRAWRTARGTPLSTLAAETGISASTLSRLETGRLRPTLEQLLPLARVHGLPLDELVGAPASGDPRIHLRPVRRHGVVFVPLSSAADGIRALKAVHPPRRGPVDRVLRSHPGHERLQVLSGRLRVVLGEEEVLLGPGATRTIDTRTPHWIGGDDPDRPTEVLLLDQTGVMRRRAESAG